MTPARDRIAGLVNEYHASTFSDGSRGHSTDATHNTKAALLAAVDELYAEIAGLRENDARYRWLRDARKTGYGKPLIAEVTKYGSFLSWNKDADTTDAAIDAARGSDL